MDGASDAARGASPPANDCRLSFNPNSGANAQEEEKGALSFPKSFSRAGLKSGSQVVIIFQANCGRSCTQQYELDSPNLGPTF